MRTLTTLLLLLGLLFATRTAYTTYETHQQKDRIQRRQTQQILDETITQLREKNDDLRAQMQYTLEDENKKKFWPTLDILGYEELLQDHLFDRYNEHLTDPDLPDDTLSTLVKQSITRLNDSLETILIRHHKVYDMSEDHLTELIDRNTATLRQTKELSGTVLTPTTPRLLMINYLNGAFELLTSIANLSTGCGFVVDSYYPFLRDPLVSLPAGQSRTLRIGIGSYASGLRPGNVALIVNGDSLGIGYDGLAEYTVRSTSNQRQKIEMRCVITNPLTGETQQGESLLWFNE